jgi:hypothetical protein
MALGLPGFALALLAARLRDPARWAALPTILQQLRSLGVGLTALLRSVIPLLIGLGLGAAAAYLVERHVGPETGLDAAVFATLAGAGLAWNIVWWVRRIRRREALGIEQLTLPGMQSGLEELAAAIRVVVDTPTHGWVFVGSAMISFGVNGIIGWAPTFMTRELELSVAEASLLLGKWGLLFGIGGTLAGGWLADTLQRRVPWARVAVSAAGFLVGGPLTIWLLTIRDLDLFVPVFCAAFFFLTWYNGPLTSVVFDVTPQRISTTVAGAYLLFIHLAGDAIALPIVGLLSDQFGIGQAVLILPVMTMLGAVTCLGALRTVRRDMARLAP